ncbi:hypothetical protein GE115_06695 [Agromyces sp. CFH 90414]|uniref:Uncharacterized protein n=1 Tax=Agromyces agglutinans TaxID=2662258 RepID=A0A6I2F5K7_9MICO|nr:hypothetical protein [Agromyces agglutinans]MRG59561.1 hypothetical protein [Agromyces agglutinans]
MNRVMLVDRMAQFGAIRARVLLVESDRGRTIVHLRAEQEGDARELQRYSRFATDGSGTALTHLVSLSGGTGIETHVLHVYDNATPERLVLVTPAGEPVMAIDFV